jgi:hypothetical protein
MSLCSSSTRLLTVISWLTVYLCFRLTTAGRDSYRRDRITKIAPNSSEGIGIRRVNKTPSLIPKLNKKKYIWESFLVHLWDDEIMVDICTTRRRMLLWCIQVRAAFHVPAAHKYSNDDTVCHKVAVGPAGDVVQNSFILPGESWVPLPG